MTCVAPLRSAEPTPFWVLLSAFVAVLSGVATLIGCGLWAWPVSGAVAVPFSVFVAMLCICRTDWGLYVTAFAIGPLGIVQCEVASITINLPEILILCLVAKEGVRFVLRGEGTNPDVPWRLLGLFMAMSCMALVVGLVNGNGTARVLQDFRQFTEYVLLYLLLTHRVRQPHQVQIILMAYLLGCTVLALHGIVQHFTDIGIPLNQALSDNVHFQGTRGGSFYGATPLGGLMVLATGVGLSLMLGRLKFPMKAAAALCMAVCLTGAVYTYTRASWVAIALTILFVGLFITKTRRFIAVSAGAALVFLGTFGPLMVERLESISFSRAEQSLHERMNYYTVAWRIFCAYPLTGLGWGCQYRVSAILVNEGWADNKQLPVRDVRKSTPPNEATVHSAYLQLLVKGGPGLLISFLLLIAAWLSLVWRAWKKSELGPQERNALVALAGGLLGYMAHSGIENFFQWPVMAQSFWMLLAVSSALCFRGMEQRTTV